MDVVPKKLRAGEIVQQGECMPCTQYTQVLFSAFYMVSETMPEVIPEHRDKSKL